MVPWETAGGHSEAAHCTCAPRCLAKAAQFLVNLSVTSARVQRSFSWQGMRTTSIATTSQMKPSVSQKCYCSTGMWRVGLQPLSLDTTHFWQYRSKNAHPLPVSLTCGVERNLRAKSYGVNFCEIWRNLANFSEFCEFCILHLPTPPPLVFFNVFSVF